MESVLQLLWPKSLDLASEAGRARERYRRAALTTLASGAARAISLATNLISIPLTLNYLGAERYGLWATISSINALLDFADLGLGNGLLNVIASGSAAGDREKIRAYVSSAFFLLLAIGAGLAGAFYLLTPLLPWQRMFGQATQSLIWDARLSSGVFVACFAASLPLGIVKRVQLGFQEGFASNLWQCSASVLSLGALLIAMRMHAGLPVLVLCLTGAPVVALALNWMVEFTRSRPWLMPALRSFHWSAGWELIRAGLLFVVLQVGSLLLSAVDPLIAARYLGLAAVADFAVAQKLFLATLTIQAMWLAPLWPAYGEAAARGDRAWVRRTLFRSTLLAVLVSALMGGVLIGFRAQVFGAWLHRDWAPSLWLSLGLGLSSVALSAGMATSMFLNGVNAIREQAGVVCVMIAVVTILKIQLCIRYGVAGLPWGMFAGYVAIMLPFLWVLIRRLLAVQPKDQIQIH